VKFKDTTPNQLYYASECHTAGYGYVLINCLLLIWSIEKTDSATTISYESLAIDSINLNPFFINVGLDHEVSPVPFSDLPLYIHFLNKSQNFDRLLKNEPLIKPKSLEVICQMKKAKYSETYLSNEPYNIRRPPMEK
jgi:hypothetical protein